MKIGTVAFLAAALAGCEDADYGTIENGLYINEAAPSDKYEQQIESMTVLGETTATVHVRLAQAMDTDVHATLELDESFVTEYNDKYGTSYQALPSDYLIYDKDVTIAAGSISSDPIVLNIKEFSTDNGEAYCIPLKVSSSSSDVRVMKASSRLLYLLEKPAVQVVPTMNWKVQPASEDEWNLELTEWTLESWVWMDSFRINNQAIFNAPHSTGGQIYVRFGDADLAYNKLQIKTGGSQFNSSTTFDKSKWYHVAFTYGSGKAKMYINGELDAELDVSSSYCINGLQLCCSGQTYFKANAKMAQVRFWSKALSASTIKSQMDKNVSPSADGLIGYWKLNEGEGSVYKDATGNGRDLICAEAPTWGTEEVNFAQPNK